MDNSINQRVINTINTLIAERLASSKKEVAEILDVSASTISEVLAGRQGATSKILEGLVKKFRINGNWLLSGEGSMLVKEAISNNLVNDPAPVYEKIPADLQRKVNFLMEQVQDMSKTLYEVGQKTEKHEEQLRQLTGR